MDTIASVLIRWIHIASVAILIGGIFYARYFARAFAERFRPVIWITSATIVGSGLFNLLTKETLPPGYHMVFGIKMLLVLHILVVGLMATTPAMDDAKRLRMLGGVSLSGLVVILISAYLRGVAA